MGYFICFSGSLGWIIVHHRLNILKHDVSCYVSYFVWAKQNKLLATLKNYHFVLWKSLTLKPLAEGPYFEPS